MSEISKTFSWVDGQWFEGNHLILGVRTHATWLGSSVFDGARAFDGVTPDLDLHCQRLNNSAEALGMNPTIRWEEMVELTKEGLTKFDGKTAIYIRPMYWTEGDGPSVVMGDSESTQFCLCIFEAPMAPNGANMSVALSTFRRPTIESMPVNAKAGCLYPNNARMLREAKGRGFDNALVRDMLGNIAELATANVFMVKDGEVHTPAINGTFLNGITRLRIIDLLKKANYKVHERSLTFQDFQDADEIFSTGNYSKVMSVTKLEERSLQPGPIALKARDLYFEFAHNSTSK